MSPLHKFIYFGTPEFSTFVLDELAAAGYQPAVVVTAPDRPAGRGLALRQTPVKQWALAHRIPVFEIEQYDDAAVDQLRTVDAELGIVAAYGKILPQNVLDLFPHGILNVHPSLLPRYRGTSPIESQILADEPDIGASIIVMDEKMDHGPILGQARSSLGVLAGRTALNTALWHEGGRLLAQLLPQWTAGTLTPSAQDDVRATFTKKIRKEDGEIDLSAPARANYLKYLAYEGWPGTYFFSNGKRVKISQARLNNGAFIIERVIPEGKKEMAYADFVSK